LGGDFSHAHLSLRPNAAPSVANVAHRIAQSLLKFIWTLGLPLDEFCQYGIGLAVRFVEKAFDQFAVQVLRWSASP
jgi:hypothetical protein